MPINDKIFAITNSQERLSENDAIVTTMLDTDMLQIYHQSKANGDSDSEIFHELFPDSEPVAVYEEFKVLQLSRLVWWCVDHR